MKKFALIFALLGSVTLAQANTTTLFNNLNCDNNSYSCSLPDIGSGYQVTDCTFTFSSVNCSLLSYLSCDLDNTWGVGTKNVSTSTWTCTLNTNDLDYLNNCISSGKDCDFDLSCFGDYNIGSCTLNYDCQRGVPDTATTVILLGIALLGLEALRRKFAP